MTLTPEYIYWLANKAVGPVTTYGPVGHLEREDLVQEAALGILENYGKLRDDARANPGSYLLMAGRWKAGELVRYHKRSTRWQGSRPRSLNARLVDDGAEMGELLAYDRRPDVVDGWPTGGEIREERRRIAEEMVAAGASVADIRDATGLTFSGAWRLSGRIRRETISQQAG